jgi:hypothetical protein
MLIKVGSLYLTLGTFIYDRKDGRLRFGQDTIMLCTEESIELERVLNEAIAGQKTIAALVEEQRAQGVELQKRVEALQQREQYVEGIALQAQQIINASQQQNKSPIVAPGLRWKRN